MQTAKERKDTPIFSGVLKYFPKALAEVARVSRAGNEQHNPGSELHWDRSKSKDEYDACARHLIDRATQEFDDDGQRHMAKVAWRALAALEKEIEGAEDTVVEIENSNSQKSADVMCDPDLSYADRLQIRQNMDDERPLTYKTTLSRETAEAYVSSLKLGGIT